MAVGSPSFPPIVPGLTAGDGSAPGAMSPTERVAMLMGMRPQRPDTTTEKMAQIIQLMREVAKQDPRIGGLVADALRVLVEGAPPGGQGPAPATPIGGPAQAPSLAAPMGGMGAG